MLKEVRGGSSRLDLMTDITAASTGLNVAGPALSNWPTGTVGPFVVRIDDELMLCSDRAGGVITVAQRGWDATAPTSHAVGSQNVRHVIDADTIADLLDHVYDDTRDDHSQYMKTDGSRPFTDVSAITGSPVPIGADEEDGDSELLARTDHVHSIPDASIAGIKLVPETITEPLLATDSVSQRVIAADSVGTSELQPNAVQTENIGAGQIVPGHIPDDSIPMTKIMGTTGVIEMFGGAAAPAGALLCDGAKYLKTAYPELAAVLGTAWNTGGELGTEFRVPNYRDRFPVGAGGAYALGATGGAATVALGAGEMPVHSHALGAVGDHVHTEVGGFAGIVGEVGTSSLWLNTGAVGDHVADVTYSYPTAAGAHNHTVANAGGGAAHENRPPYAGVNFIIWI